MLENFIRKEKNGIVFYESTLFVKNSIPHLFASRMGGASDGDFDSLNFSTVRKNRHGNTDSEDNVAENYRRVLSLFDLTKEKVADMRQIHSDIVLSANNVRQECDGIYSAKGWEIQAACVKTADCVPVLLYDTANDAFCAIHAGWRGTVSGICKKAVEAMRNLHSSACIIAAIGPCIGKCCYEVGKEVYDRALEGFAAAGGNVRTAEACFTATGEMKYHVDLGLLNGAYLELSGLCDREISVSGMCTCCYEEGGKKPFFSHRASGGFSGTQISLVKSRA